MTAAGTPVIGAVVFFLVFPPFFGRSSSNNVTGGLSLSTRPTIT